MPQFEITNEYSKKKFKSGCSDHCIAYTKSTGIKKCCDTSHNNNCTIDIS